MPLEDPTRIDIITKSKEGGIGLVITDAGITTDPQRRYEKLCEKLGNYVRYVDSDAFREKYPGLTPEMVSIQVVSQNEPTEQMRRIEFVRSDGDPSIRLPVSFQVLSEETMRRSRDQSIQAAQSGKKEASPFGRLIGGCLSGNMEKVRQALDDGANPNEKLMDQVPLLYAGYAGHLEVIKLLIERGAELKYGTGQVLWIYAKLNRHKDVARFVRERRISINLFTHLGLLIGRVKRVIKRAKGNRAMM
jgi:hypothetical protein